VFGVEDLSALKRQSEAENDDKPMDTREPYFQTNPYVELFKKPRTFSTKIGESKMFEAQLGG